MSQDHSTKVLLQIKDPNITDLVVQKIEQVSRVKITQEFLGSFSEFAYRDNLFSTALLFF